MIYPVKTSIGQQPYITTISTYGHTIYSDEPVDKGGLDKGPAPKDLLMASLGSCTCITLSMFARRKQWPLEGVDVELALSEDDHDGKHFNTIERKITLLGTLTTEQRERLLQVANACPVHKILTGSIDIKTSLT